MISESVEEISEFMTPSYLGKRKKNKTEIITYGKNLVRCNFSLSQIGAQHSFYLPLCIFLVLYLFSKYIVYFISCCRLANVKNNLETSHPLEMSEKYVSKQLLHNFKIAICSCLVSCISIE